MRAPRWPMFSPFAVSLFASVLGAADAPRVAEPPDDARSEQPASLVLKARRIWTGDRDRPWAEALAARDGAIVAVGTRAEVARFEGPSTRVIDLPRALAVPGLIDAHGHMGQLGAAREAVDLRGAASPEEVARRVRQRAEKAPGGSWIQGDGWDQSLWPTKAFSNAAVLDAAAPDRPVWLRRVDGHAGWANSEAMRRAKIAPNTPSPADGRILHDANGQPTGVFIDGAMDLIERAIPAPTKDDVRRWLLSAQGAALEVGLTGAHDPGISPLEADVYRELDRERRLKMRVYGMARPPAGGEVEFVSRPPEQRPPGSRFELRAIKLFMDGAMGSRGALLFEPYSDDPGNTGLMLIGPKTIEATATAALRHGWQVATHAIGDRANALVLDAYAAALQAVPEARTQARGPRLRVEHAQTVRFQDVARFRDLGVIASMQPSHASDDMRWADARLGPERAQGAYAWRWFLNAGVPLAFGSDFPVSIVDPLWGLQAAVTRQDDRGRPPGGWHPDQILALDVALRAFTAGAAHAEFAEGRFGTLKPGLRADVTIFDRDLFESPPGELIKARALMTIIDGEIVFEREQQPEQLGRSKK